MPRDTIWELAASEDVARPGLAALVILGVVLVLVYLTETPLPT